MLKYFKNVIRRNYLLICIIYIYHNLRLALKRLSGSIGSDSGTTHSQLTIQDSVNYITTVFNDYKRIAGIERFYGRIAEIGPGDNAGVALCFLADGCHQVDLADRFYSHRDLQQEKKIYEALSQTNLGIQYTDNLPGIMRYYGNAAAAENFFSNESKYDFIVSRSVLEHVDDPLLAIQAMTRALKPGGKLIHKIDLRDHGMFSNHYHELKFFEVPWAIYRLMTYRSGYPNRILINSYRACVEELRQPYTFFITQLAGIGPIVPHVPFTDISQSQLAQAFSYLKQHKHKFAKSLDEIADEDLIVSGFFLVVTKEEV